MSVNFRDFDSDELYSTAHVQLPVQGSVKRSAEFAGMDGHLIMPSHFGKKKEEKISLMHGSKACNQSKSILSNGKKTKGRVKIKMEFIDNKLRRYTTFSKRKTGIMKKAYELSTLTGTQVMLLVASETGHVYTFATRKLQPMITSEAGKALIQTCLNSPDPPNIAGTSITHDQRMSATGYEETELNYAVPEDDQMKNSPEDFLNENLSCSGSESSIPPSPSDIPEIPSPLPSESENISHSLSSQLPPGIIFSSSNASGGSVLVGGTNRSMMYTTGGGVVYATPSSSDPSSRMMVGLPSGLHLSTSDHDTRNPSDVMNFPIHLATAAALQKAAASVSQSNTCMQALPTDLSMHIKRENRS